MAGIYLHIPFCKTRCIYCDFYSTTRSELITRYIHALCNELEMRKEYLKEEKIETVYFGGGTPSQLGEEDFNESLKSHTEALRTGRLPGDYPGSQSGRFIKRIPANAIGSFPSTASVWEYKLSMTQLSNY